MKKYWKGIGLCILILISIIIGVSSCEIQSPEEVVSSNKDEITEVEENNNEATDDAVDEVANNDTSSDVINTEESTPSEVPNETTSEETSNVETSKSTASVVQEADKNTTINQVSDNQVPEKSTVQEPKVEEKKLYASLTIECKTILSNMDKLSANKKGSVPAGGIIYSNTLNYTEGKTVLDVLKSSGITIDANGGYIKGISNLYEFDCGGTSGWMYSVNGEFKRVSAGSYKVKNGDKIQFRYTVNSGDLEG
ncbi:DUF4430 domain-containing protein [Clostridium vincentii]|uniref:Transcobalamin-like C-terminal domain-containing protein n=1 Tax=Clostridium vincentii TaxID=52704 RepID=A0A2T0BHP8_9CLOT|nr:DUF4430 domain-containing protein [Clostridium vincentii]PRR83398.1 hypothetical protein CLVI_09450 [Clostridium vincentii]